MTFASFSSAFLIAGSKNARLLEWLVFFHSVCGESEAYISCYPKRRVVVTKDYMHHHQPLQKNIQILKTPNGSTTKLFGTSRQKFSIFKINPTVYVRLTQLLLFDYANLALNAYHLRCQCQCCLAYHMW